jgi:hypothetical protein
MLPCGCCVNTRTCHFQQSAGSYNETTQLSGMVLPQSNRNAAPIQYFGGCCGPTLSNRRQTVSDGIVKFYLACVVAAVVIVLVWPHG